MAGNTADLAPDWSNLDEVGTTALRMLSIDCVEQANSGHPGLPLGMAPTAWTLFSKFLRFDPGNPHWPGRDRFILSAGHGSALLYSLLHLFGFEVSKEDLAKFRQLGSITPGHPEYSVTPGVETTTGPLGQGIANGVGMALAAEMEAARYRSTELFDSRVFVICSDGDLMEGISNEAASLAGHLGLKRLVVLYDDNHISIDGSTDLAFSEDVLGRFSALGWNALRVEDGNDLVELTEVLSNTLSTGGERPTIIAVRTVIGFGAPTREGTAKVHGSALGELEYLATKARYGWPVEKFHVPQDLSDYLDRLVDSKVAAASDWHDGFAKWKLQNEDLGELWDIAHSEISAEEVSKVELDFAGKPGLATRSSSKLVISALVESFPQLVVGTADLGESTGVDIELPAVSRDNFEGSFVHFGVREHAMGAMLNGMVLYGGIRPFGSTFLVFSDYERPAIRLAALMEIPTIFVFTHDSVAVGEDGPTHEPIEHVTALRLIPHLAVVRPADSYEVQESWKLALMRHEGPTALILSRQGLPDLPVSSPGWLPSIGARVVSVEEGEAQLVLIGTGSEVSVLMEAKTKLGELGVSGVRVVSMPWRERFLGLGVQMQSEILPIGVPRVSLEAGVTLGWREVVGESGVALGINSYGASGKGSDVMKQYGIDAGRVVSVALELLGLSNP